MDGSRSREGSLGPRAPGYPTARIGDMRDVDLAPFPAGPGPEKALMRRKLLQPLPDTAARGQLPRPWEVTPPPPRPQPAEQSARPPLPPSAQKSSTTSERPGTGQRPPTGQRPRTAERRPPVGKVGFPSQLNLRGPNEAPNCPFARPEALVLPLDTQQAVRSLAIACSGGRQTISDGVCLTAWVLATQEGVASSDQLLEPLAARRLDRSLAVEPIELVAERQASGSSEELRYGEGFRLRAAGCTGLYLGHGGGEGGPGGLRWVSAPPSGAADEEQARPRGTRFAAHGGELGAPMVFGSQLSLLRVQSPPPSDAESEYDDSESESGSESDADRLPRRPPAAKVPAKAEEPTQLASPLMPEAGRYATEGLFARAADTKGGVFSATLLPLFAEPLS